MNAVTPPVAPMLAKAIGSDVPAPDSVPGGLLFEPKWDGFRCLVFRDGESVFVQSRQGEDLAYCFPELVDAALRVLPPQVVLDGELVIAHNGRLEFELLSQRIRPRSEAGGWKIAELARDHPTSYVAFDMLSIGGENLMAVPFAERRRRLEAVPLSAPLHLTPVTADHTVATEWFGQFEGAGLDGLVAKPAAGHYEPGKRTMFKIKHARTADVVVAGWRPHKQPGPDGSPVVGSLLLGLYDDAGTLHHVGVAASFSAARRVSLTEELAPLAVRADDPHPWHWARQSPVEVGSPDAPEPSGASGRSPGASAKPAAAPEPAATRRQPGMVSRWSAGKSLAFELLRPELVAEVAYDHMEGPRFRHVTKLVRFRPDREPKTCTYDQLDTPLRVALDDVVPGLGG